MLNISSENIFLVFLFLLFFFFWKKFILIYTQAKLYNIKVDLIRKNIEFNNCDKFNELIKFIEMLSANLNLISISSYCKYKNNINKEEFENFKKQEQQKINSYSKEIQKVIIETEKRIYLNTLFYMLHRNVFLAIISMLIAICLFVVIFIKLLFRFSASKETISEDYDETYQEIASKYIPSDKINSFLETKIA